MTYTIPNHININKIFIINRSELEGRIDPHQYHIERRSAISRLSKNNKLLKLSDVVKNVKIITSSISESDTYIGLENILEKPPRLTPLHRHYLKLNLFGGWGSRHLDFPR